MKESRQREATSGKRRVLFRSALGCQQVPALIRQRSYVCACKREKVRKRKVMCYSVIVCVYVAKSKCLVNWTRRPCAEGRPRPALPHKAALCQTIVINPHKGLLDNSNWPFASFIRWYITAEYWEGLYTGRNAEWKVSTHGVTSSDHFAHQSSATQ